MKPIIEVRNIWKQYKIGSKNSRYLSFRDQLKKSWFLKEKKATFWALQNINFDVYEGDCIGIIGRNGSGKSTLLKILSKITPPTKGYIHARGRIASLLEVGTGFHPELTGRENIYLNGSILGLKRTEINQKFDEIVAFSGVELFLDTPLKHYSSGMQLRLAFSVAAHLEPQILLVDEVLAVGDLEFQKKCLGKMNEVTKQGRTVLFVSHNLGVVKQLCSKGILLSNGENKNYNYVSKLIEDYANQRIIISKHSLSFQGPLGKLVSLKDIRLNDKSLLKEEGFVSQLDSLCFKISFYTKAISNLRITFSIYKDSSRLFSLHDTHAEDTPEGHTLSAFHLPAKILRPGIYTIGIGGLQGAIQSNWFYQWDITSFTILEEWDDTIEKINHGLINITNTRTYRINL